jgi:hypothetical protein
LVHESVSLTNACAIRPTQPKSVKSVTLKKLPLSDSALAKHHKEIINNAGAAG